MACRLSCPAACGILVPWPGIQPASPALQDRFLTTGPSGKSRHLLIKWVRWSNLLEPHESELFPRPALNPDVWLKDSSHFQNLHSEWIYVLGFSFIVLMWCWDWTDTACFLALCVLESPSLEEGWLCAQCWATLETSAFCPVSDLALGVGPLHWFLCWPSWPHRAGSLASCWCCVSEPRCDMLALVLGCGRCSVGAGWVTKIEAVRLGVRRRGGILFKVGLCF